MKVYHGTTDKAAHEIKREGLKRTPASNFKVFRPDNPFHRINISDERFVYVTPDKQMAANFAEFRTQYEHAAKGEKIHWGNDVYFVKETDERQVGVQPAIVELELPVTLASKLHPDPEGPSSHGFVYQGNIPAEYVERIEVLQ